MFKRERPGNLAIHKPDSKSRVFVFESFEEPETFPARKRFKRDTESTSGSGTDLTAFPNPAGSEQSLADLVKSTEKLSPLKPPFPLRKSPGFYIRSPEGKVTSDPSTVNQASSTLIKG